MSNNFAAIEERTKSGSSLKADQRGDCEECLFKLLRKECDLFKNPHLLDTASRRIVVQDSIAMEPLDDAVLHLHRYMTHDAQ